MTKHGLFGYINSNNMYIVDTIIITQNGKTLKFKQKFLSFRTLHQMNVAKKILKQKLKCKKVEFKLL